jgi:fluoroacetyl-CoA thioesterase
MHQIQAGAKREERLLVTAEEAIDFMGVENARVFATPHLVGRLEYTCRNLVKPMLEDGYDTVGTHVDIRHLAATPVGMAASFHAEVVSVDDRRVNFRVEAFDEKEKIAEGTHQRFIVNVARFAARLAEKAALPRE